MRGFYYERLYFVKGIITYIYFIQADNGLTKIGKSANVTQRYSDLCNMSPAPLTIVYCQMVDKPLSTERALHLHFAEQRHHGEWFALSDEQLAEAKCLLASEQVLREKYTNPTPRPLRTERLKEYQGTLFSTRAISTIERAYEYFGLSTLTEIARLEKKQLAVLQGCSLRTAAEIHVALSNAGYQVIDDR